MGGQPWGLAILYMKVSLLVSGDTLRGSVHCRWQQHVYTARHVGNERLSNALSLAGWASTGGPQLSDTSSSTSACMRAK